MTALTAALRLLTVIPLPSAQDSAASLGRAAAFFPLVGLGIGAAAGGTGWAAHLIMPDIASAALAVTIWVLLTGAIHLDGLADTADGIFGGDTPARRLEIMRDPHTGVFGSVAIGLSLLLKLAFLSALIGGGHWSLIVLSPLAGRLAAVAAMALIPYARHDGLGAPYTFGMKTNLAVAGATAVAAAFVLSGPWAIIVLVAGVAAGFALALFAASRLGGGLTGDTYGASVEAGEAIALLAAVVMAGAGLALSPLW